MSWVAVPLATAGRAAVRRRLFVLALRQVADQLDDGAAKLCRADFHEAGDQRQPVGRGQEFRDMGERRRLGGVRFRARDAGRAFKEKFHRHLENVRDLLQPAGADPVDALLVFLDLLEGKVEAVGQGGLHAEHQAAHADARADVLVGRVGSLDRHHSAIPFAGVLRISTGRKLPQCRMPPARAPQLAVGEGAVPRSLRFLPPRAAYAMLLEHIHRSCIRRGAIGG